MTGKSLSTYFKLHRRYYRSVNLERDFDQAEMVQGYVPTERSADALRRILSAFGNPRAHRIWTMTGVYGTGKSAFAHYLSCLCAPTRSESRRESLAIAEGAFGVDSSEMTAIESQLPQQGLLRAVATAQREPLSCTIARALVNGAETFWQGKRNKPEFWQEITDWAVSLEDGKTQITSQQVLKLLKAIVGAAKVNVLLLIDELGKSLEFAAQHHGIADLYLLQQIAELRLKGEHQVYFLGILHQSFAGYSERLAAIEQSEWSKIQGRFEDIPFTESDSQMTRLIGQAIDRTEADPLLSVIQTQAKQWFNALQEILSEHELSVQVLADAFPLHPVTAVVLPMLCTRYAQNDRSLFTFLTSDEPYAFARFLNTTTVQDAPDENFIPTLKLHQIYDYFVESVTGLASRINLQRWVEIQSLIQDARDRSPDVLKVLKTIGILNLVSAHGALRATPKLVAMALCDIPKDHKEQKHWQKVIKDLQQKGVIIHRKLSDELRIWEGSDFNVEAAIYQLLETERQPLADLLAATHPLKPLVAQRHYTTTGNLRYFEQRYVDSRSRLSELRCSSHQDGLIAYWMDTELPAQVPAQTVEGKPLIVVSTDKLDVLRIRAQELRALRTIQKNAPELQTDGVARKEVRHRLVEAERLLDETTSQAFDWSSSQNSCWVEGKLTAIHHPRAFQAMLSKACDQVYHLGLVLDNELINRRELTSQGAKARRELIEAMLEREHQQRLGLAGYGPEVAMYYSVLEATGIHSPFSSGDAMRTETGCERQEAEIWGFHPPQPQSGVATVWQKIDQFCRTTKDTPRSLDQLYAELEAPPYGVKSGVVPVLLAAVLLYYLDEVSLYKDGTFIPVLGAEHFELLVKAPERFAVKYIEVAGLRSEVFRELEAVLRASPAKGRSKGRNSTVLSIVKPLVGFVRKLPAYTLKTKRISPEAQAVIQTLLQTQEPDTLLFTALPQACGLDPIRVEGHTSDNVIIARTFRETLVQLLREIHTAYELLLKDCELLLYSAFGLRSNQDQLRQDLQFRARYLLGNCADSSLDRFVRAAVNETSEQRVWLEALLMIVADKPAEAWSDADRTLFEVKLGDLARRFRNLEALQKEVASYSKGGFEARRITVTQPDGKEIHQMVWMDHEQRTKLAPMVKQILEECGDRAVSPQEVRQLQQALLTLLTEAVLGEGETLSLAEPADFSDHRSVESPSQTKKKSRRRT